jgi:hypothetical protein
MQHLGYGRLEMIPGSLYSASHFGHLAQWHSSIALARGLTKPRYCHLDIAHLVFSVWGLTSPRGAGELASRWAVGCAAIEADVELGK